MSFTSRGGPNLLADLGMMSIGVPGGYKYHVRGGHRLWVAPEVPEITYEPDDDPVLLERNDSTVTLRQLATEAVGIEKAVSITLSGGQTVLTHTIVNRSDETRDLASWGITQLVTGGTAIIPLSDQPADPHGLMPNETVVLWPYTGVADTPFVMSDRVLLVNTVRTSPMKLGVPLSRGWLAYHRGSQVFVKRFEHVDGGRYLDQGASGQCYCNADFLELETLSEQRLVQPGQSVTHREAWELHQVEPGIPTSEIPALLELDSGAIV